jgi:hypothetical protein
MTSKIENGWASTPLTPDTALAQWITVDEVFDTLLDRIGIPSRAAKELHYYLAAGGLEPSMALRNVGTPDHPKWQARDLGVWLWRRLLSFYADKDATGRDVLGFATGRMSEAEYVEFRRVTWIIYVSRDRVEAFLATLPPAKTAQRGRRSTRGKKTAFDWEAALIEAAAFMYQKDPGTLEELVDHIDRWFGEDGPKETQLKMHLRPLFTKLGNKPSN